MEDSDDDVVQLSPCKRYSRCNEILGRGAFKTVYKGFDEVDGIEVAWNQVSIDDTLQSPEHLEMLYAEVHLLKTLKHEKIIKSYMSWVDLENKTINMITELFTSGNLRQYRRKHRTVDVKAIKHWARQILHGLHYLHSHNPPIIHRDLKCDNIFINGNHGEVKLGDLGLATIMLQPTARSVIGTPEFMAPELYDEEYNELVDIYSFGMCILELVTCEYPYSECKNAAQIFKMVTSGLKPAALAKVKDPLIKQFIEKCLVPASQRLSAAELLNDPFLSSQCSKEMLVVSLHISDAVPKFTNFPSCGKFPMEEDPKHKNISCGNSTESMNGTSHLSSLEIQRHKFKLFGEKQDSVSISLTLRINDPCEPVQTFSFPLYLYSDTLSSIAGEMVDDLDLPNEDVTIISEMINDLVLKLEPRWKPSIGTSCSANYLHDNSLTSHADELDLPNEDVTIISEMINDLVLKLEPRWEPSIGTSCSANSLHDNSLTSHVDTISTSSTVNHGSNDIFTEAVGENYILSPLFEVNNDCWKHSCDDSLTSHVDAISTNSAGNHGPNDIFTEAVGENYILALFFEVNNGSWKPSYDNSLSSHVDAVSTSSEVNHGSNDIFAVAVGENYILSSFFEVNNGADVSVELSFGNYDPVALDAARSSSTGANTVGCSKEVTRYDSACSDSDAYFSLFNDISSGITSLSLVDKFNEEELCEDLKLELDAIEMDYQRCFSDLMRRRHDAIENLKRKWSTKQKLSFVSCK